MALQFRNSIKTLLLNENNELLLMCCNDPKTTSLDGKSRKLFWTCIGGEIEEGEDVKQAALREIYEETSIESKYIKLGPIVWHGEFSLILSGKPTHIKQQFIVAHTTAKTFSLENLTKEETPIVTHLKWFSLKDLQSCPDIIYPVVLRDHITDIVVGNYPKEPLELDLGKQS